MTIAERVARRWVKAKDEENLRSVSICKSCIRVSVGDYEPQALEFGEGGGDLVLSQSYDYARCFSIDGKQEAPAFSGLELWISSEQFRVHMIALRNGEGDGKNIWT